MSTQFSRDSASGPTPAGLYGQIRFRAPASATPAPALSARARASCSWTRALRRASTSSSAAASLARRPLQGGRRGGDRGRRCSSAMDQALAWASPSRRARSSASVESLAQPGVLVEGVASEGPVCPPSGARSRPDSGADAAEQPRPALAAGATSPCSSRVPTSSSTMRSRPRDLGFERADGGGARSSSAASNREARAACDLGQSRDLGLERARALGTVGAPGASSSIWAAAAAPASARHGPLRPRSTALPWAPRAAADARRLHGPRHLGTQRIDLEPARQLLARARSWTALASRTLGTPRCWPRGGDAAASWSSSRFGRFPGGRQLEDGVGLEDTPRWLARRHVRLRGLLLGDAGCRR